MRYQSPSRLVLIQCITTEWTKSTRDAVSASTRNSLPETLPLPDKRPGIPGHVEHQTADIYYQYTHYDELNNYQKPFKQFWVTLQSRLPNRTLFSPVVDPRRAFVRGFHKWNDYEGADYEHWFEQQSRLFKYYTPHYVIARNPISLIDKDGFLQIEFYPGSAPFSPPHGLEIETAKQPSDFHKLKKLPLLPRQWIQIRFNEKSTRNEWTYLKSVLNVGYTDIFDSNFFLENPPTHQYSDLARLW